MTDLEEALLGVADDAKLMVGLADLAQQTVLQSVRDSAVMGLTGDQRAFLDGGRAAIGDFVAEIERIREAVNAPPF